MLQSGLGWVITNVIQSPKNLKTDMEGTATLEFDEIEDHKMKDGGEDK